MNRYLNLALTTAIMAGAATFAQFLYDTASDTFNPFGKDSSFGTTTCYKCHTAAKATDYIFTHYPLR